jgi:signal peptidase I
MRAKNTNVEAASGRGGRESVPVSHRQSRTVADGPGLTTGPGSGGLGTLASTKPDWTAEFISIESVLIGGRRRIVYTGPSMNPTLREPDLLWVEPYGNRTVRAGDVVCYRSPGDDVNIVHRVVSVGGPGTRLTKDGIRTRGDNNPTDDPRVLQAGDIIGQVVAAQRGPRLRRIPGSHIGRMIARSVRLRRPILIAVTRVASSAYQGLARSGPFDFLLHGDMKPRPVSFSGRGKRTLKLLVGRRTVGHFDCHCNRWRIRRPFRLFVDERSLPDPRSPAANPRPR